MSTIADKLQDLVMAKEDMKSALIEKGVTPTGGLSTYADAVREIEVEDVVYSDGIKFQESEFEEAPTFNTIGMTQMNVMFYDCEYLTDVPLYNTSNVVTMRSMFSGCHNLPTIPRFDTRNVTDMAYMFTQCTKLTTIPRFDTSSVTNMEFMFFGCTALERLPVLDMGNVMNVEGILMSCNNITYIGGFINLGKQEQLNVTNAFYGCTKLTRYGIMNIINNLYDRNTAGYSVINLPLGGENLARISDEEKAIATNKGWILS